MNNPVFKMVNIKVTFKVMSMEINNVLSTLNYFECQITSFRKCIKKISFFSFFKLYTDKENG